MFKPRPVPSEGDPGGEVELAAELCHEVNQPLTNLLSSLEMVRRGLLRATAANGSQQLLHLTKWVEGAYASAEHLARVVGDMRSQTLREPHPPRALDVRQPIRAALAMVEHEASRRAQLVCELPAPAWVVANDTRLVQVLLNLMVNAMLAIPAGKPEDNRLVVRLSDTLDGLIAIEIRDTGAGIPTDQLHRVTEAYFTTRSSDGVSMGLGLAICKRIVTGYGGRLLVERAPDRGTLARVLLPRTDPPTLPTEG
jgi:two-component system NtrC family sensor kinase